MCSSAVVWRPPDKGIRGQALSGERPRYRHSTVWAVRRTSSGRRAQGGGDGVVVSGDLDVVVDVDPDLLPLGEHVALGGQRAKRGAVELLEQRAPRARELAQRARVEPLHKLGEACPRMGESGGRVEFGQREECAVTERSQYPALDHLHAHPRFPHSRAGFDLGLVPRAAHPCREHRDPVVAGQVVVGRVGVGLVAMRPAHRRAQIVGDDQLGTATEELERARACPRMPLSGVRRNPVRQALRPRGPRVRGDVARRPEHGHEHLRSGSSSPVWRSTTPTVCPA